MAFRDLVEGECGAANSLVRLTSHFAQDRAMKEEGLFHPFPRTPGGDADQLVQEFLGETVGPPPQTFHMDSLLREMRAMELSGPIQGPGVAALATADPGMFRGENSIWAEQFVQPTSQYGVQDRHGIPNPEEQMWIPPPFPPPAPAPDEVFEFGFGPNWASEYLQSNENNVESADTWVDESVKSEENQQGKELQDSARKLLETTNDPKFSYSKFMQFMGKVSDGEVTINEGQVVDNSNQWANELVEEENARAVDPAEDQDLNSAWLDHLDDFRKDTLNWEEYDQYKEASKAWMIANSQQDNTPEDAEKYRKTVDNILKKQADFFDVYKKYVFAAENPMMGDLNALEEGKRLLALSDLPGAVLCFEAAVQQSQDDIAAWLLLGKTQQENEQDPMAIAAFRNALELDPHSLPALMGLAVSYTNENVQNIACDRLRDWLLNHPKYGHLAIPKSADSDDDPIYTPVSMLSKRRFDEVRAMYVAAARMVPTGDIDADVQCGLGVLFNLISDYDKAVDCFNAALRTNPKDPLMWNRVGATLANGHRCEEAVAAYSEALKLAPGFIRARYNLGITCLNLKVYKEAAEHLLTALNQQARNNSSVATMSDTIWSTLRLVLSLLDRRDLFPAADERNLAVLNAEFNMD